MVKDRRKSKLEAEKGNSLTHTKNVTNIGTIGAGGGVIDLTPPVSERQNQNHIYSL